MSDGKNLEEDMANAGSFTDALDKTREPLMGAQEIILHILSECNTPINIDKIVRQIEEYDNSNPDWRRIKYSTDHITGHVLRLVKSGKISITQGDLYSVASSE